MTATPTAETIDRGDLGASEPPSSAVTAPESVPAGPSAMVASVRHGRGISLLAIVQALIMAAGLARWKSAALLVGPSGVGFAVSIDRVAQLVLTIGSLALPVVAIQFLSRLSDGCAVERRRLARALLRYVLLGTTLAALAALLLVRWFPRLGDVAADGLALPFLLAMCAVPFTAGTALLKSVYASAGQYRRAAATTLTGSIVLVAATYLFTRAWGLPGLFAATLLTAAGTFAAMWPVVRRRHTTEEAGSVLSIRELAREEPAILRFGVTSYVAILATSLLYGVEQTAGLHLVGATAAGYLAASVAIASALRVVFGEAGLQYLMPLMSRSRPVAERIREGERYLRVLAVLLLLVGVPILLFPAELLALLYSREFAEGAQVLAILIVAEGMFVFSDAFRCMYLGLGDPAGWLKTAVPIQALTIPLLVWAGKAHGLIGIAYAHLAGTLLVFAITLLGLRLRHGVVLELRSVLVLGYVTVALCGVGALGATQPGLLASAGPSRLVLAPLVAAPLLAVAGFGPLRSLLPGVRGWPRRSSRP